MPSTYKRVKGRKAMGFQTINWLKNRAATHAIAEMSIEQDLITNRALAKEVS